MKILMVSEFYPPVIGGMERHVQSLSQGLAQRGHEVVVCTMGYRDLPNYEEEAGVKIHRLEGFFQRIPLLFKDPAMRYHPPVRDWSLIRQLGPILEAENSDIVHTHGRILYSALALKKRFDIPIVATLHTYALFCPNTSLMRGNAICDKPFTRDCIACGKDMYGMPKSLFAYYGTRMNKGNLKSVDRFIAVSSFVKQVHAKHLGLSDKDIVMIPNFYSPEVESGKEIELPEDFILFVGGLTPRKGVNLLIEAYQKLNIKTKLTLMGGTHPDYLYNSTENILVIEKVPHMMVMQAISRCRFAVFPSIWPEPCPTVAFEAMSQRKAVIASEIGGLKDIVVDGETGILVPPNNSDKLADAIAHLLKNPETASKMGARGYERFMKHYTPDAVIPRIVDVYENLI